MNIKWKIIILVMLLIASTCSIFISLFISENRKNIDLAIEREVENTARFIKVLEESRYQSYRGRIQSFVNYKVSKNREMMLQAFAARDRDNLQKRSRPFLDVLRKENPYFSTLAWVTPDNRNYLRVHDPDGAFFDDVSRMGPDIVWANQVREPVSNYMVAKSGLQYRLVHPVDYGELYLGLVQFGIDIRLLLDTIREELSIPVGVVIPNDRAAFITKSDVPLHRGEGFSIISNYLELFADMPFAEWGAGRQSIDVGGKTHVVADAFDFTNHLGESQGRLFIALNVTAQMQKLKTQLVFVVAVSVAVLFLSFAILYPSYGTLMGQIVLLNNRLKKHNDELEQTVRERTNSLVQSNERFEKLSSLTFEGIVLHDRGVALDVNRSFERLFGYSRDELIGFNMVELIIPEEHHSTVEEKIWQEEPDPYEIEGRKKDGTVFPMEVVSRQIQDGDESYRVTSLRDVTRRKGVEDALVASEQRYQLLADSTFEAIFFSEKGICVDQNLAAEAMFGYSLEEALGRAGTEWIAHEDRDLVARNMQSDSQGSYQVTALRKDGTTFPCEIQAKTMFVDGKDIRITALRDITEQRQAEIEQRNLEQQLRQKFKMEAVGMMAGGIAHNFNNSLAIVLTSLEMAQRRISQPDKVRGYIDNARTAVMRSRDLVKQIMTYSRADIHDTAPIQLGAVVDETLKLLRSTSPTTIRINYRADDVAKLTVKADPGRIQEILLNLYTNAAHAMDESGTIEICLDQARLDAADIPAQYECLPGYYAKMTFSDDGCGMEPEVLEKMFDPFYTTKEIHEGTGMGLSTVQEIIDQHGGLIRVESRPGQGSKFELFFPLTDFLEGAPQLQDEVTTRGTENILLVDDEKELTDLAEEMLSELGYHVTAVTSSVEALELIIEKPDHFGLVVTDQTMPGLTGQELAVEIGKVNVDIPVVLCTGYSNKVSVEQIAEYNISAFCRKPLGLSEFSGIIRGVLDRNQV